MVFLRAPEAKTIYTYIFLIFLSFLSCLAWSLQLLNEWGSDYGTYYSGAYYIDEDYGLYSGFFDHKGPIIYLFLKVVGSLIGWGPLQASVSLLFLALIYVSSLILICIAAESRKWVAVYVGMTASLSVLFQPSNASIAFLQLGLINLSLAFLLLARSIKSVLMLLLISSLFYSAAILCRIDSLVFLPSLLLALYSTSASPSRFKFFKYSVFYLSGTLLSLVLLYLYCGKVLFFSFDDYVTSNIIFNAWYKDNVYPTLLHSLRNYIGFVVRRGLALDMLRTTLVVPLLLIVCGLVSGPMKLHHRMKQKTNAYSADMRIIGLVYLAAGVVLFLYTASDKNYHRLLVISPTLALIGMSEGYLPKRFVKMMSAIIVSMVLAITLVNTSRATLTTGFAVGNSFESFNSNLIRLGGDTVSDLRASSSAILNGKIHVVGGQGWTYLFGGFVPARSVNDWWLYSPARTGETYTNSHLLKMHNDLLDSPSGQIFLLDNGLLDLEKSDRNALLDELIMKSSLKKRYDDYALMVIN